MRKKSHRSVPCIYPQKGPKTMVFSRMGTFVWISCPPACHLSYYCWPLPFHTVFNLNHLPMSPWIHTTEEINEYEEEKKKGEKGRGWGIEIKDSRWQFVYLLCEQVRAQAWLKRGTEEICKKGRQVISLSTRPPLISSSLIFLPFPKRLMQQFCL